MQENMQEIVIARLPIQNDDFGDRFVQNAFCEFISQNAF